MPSSRRSTPRPWELSDATVDLALELGCAAVAVAKEALDARAVARATDAGLTVAAWTARSTAEVDRLRTLGVMAACVEGEALPKSDDGEPRR
jgi:hypothetical protein